MLLIYNNASYFLSELHSKIRRHYLQHSFLHCEIRPGDRRPFLDSTFSLFT